MGKKLLLIMNPCSGKMVGKRYLADILEKFCRAEYVPTVYLTTGRGNARELAMAYGGETDLVVCMGGDGTFNEVVAGMLTAGHTTSLGYIPCGSTNDFAGSIGLAGLGRHKGVFGRDVQGGGRFQPQGRLSGD